MKPRTHVRTRLVATALAAGALSPAACAGSEVGPPVCEGLAAGDLVITEIMANPAGDDAGREWFEVFNAGDAAIDIAGLELAASRADTTNERTHTVTAGEIGPGEYFVLGGVLDDIRPPHVSYGYGSDLGNMVNSSGRVAVRCGDVEVDDAIYDEMDDGFARQFDGVGVPSHLLNDDLELWCNASDEFLQDNFGTPGEANRACFVSGQCTDGAITRDVDPPQPGDLVITEFMANPAAVLDADGEWFEVFVGRDVDLNGVSAGRDAASLGVIVNDTSCVRATAGSFLVFAASADPEVNGGLPAVDFEIGFSLTNSGGGLAIGVGDAPVDEIAWTATVAGEATSLDPNRVSAADNDVEDNFCVNADDVYGAGDTGTPGGRNPQCPDIVPAGMCDDGGALRPIVSPAAGQAVITEFMPNPAQVADSAGEWFEVRFDADVDLNELELGRVAGTVDATVQSPQCLRVTAGTHAVFARSADPGVNGGLPRVDATFGFSLNNSSSGIFVGVGGEVLDSVTYAGSTAGASTSLDEIGGGLCDGVDPYGLGDLGTPGAANPPCL